jgi:hypothetical protein
MDAAFAFLSARNGERSQWPIAMRVLEDKWEIMHSILERPVRNEEAMVQWLYLYSYEIKDACHCELNTMYWGKDDLYDEYNKQAQYARMQAMMLAHRWQ